MSRYSVETEIVFMSTHRRFGCGEKMTTSITLQSCRLRSWGNNMAVLVCLVLCGGASFSLYGQGQVAFASLSGTVEDESGAIVPQAEVTLSSPERNFARSFTSDDQGRFALTLIPPGSYTLRVTHQGFRTYTQSGIQLAVGQSATLNIQLSVGEVTQEVTVTASALSLERKQFEYCHQNG
jgi:hypothetical protein